MMPDIAARNLRSSVDTIHEITIEKLNYGGQGIGRIAGKVCFAGGTIPGETIRVRIVEEKRDYSIGELCQVIEPSPHGLSRLVPYF